MTRRLGWLGAFVAVASGCASKPDAASSTSSDRGTSTVASTHVAPSGSIAPLGPGTAFARSADIRFHVVGMPSKVASATDIDVEKRPFAAALDAGRATLTRCYEDAGAAADAFVVVRVSASGAAESVRTVRSSEKGAEPCVVGSLEKISFGPQQRPSALGVWLKVHPRAESGGPAPASPSSSSSSSSGPPRAPLATCAERDNVLSILPACGAPPEPPGNMWGDSIGDAASSGGLGLSGIGGPDRGEGIGLGRPGNGRKRPPQVRMGGGMTVTGKLPPEVIQRIVRQHFGKFRLCYEKGLEADPALAGRISVDFTIAEDASVKGVTHTTDLKDPAVGSCVARVFDGISFPQPESGVVKVSYPFAFAPGETAPKKQVTSILGIELATLTGPALARATTRDAVVAASVEGDPAADVPFVVFADSAGDHYAITRVPEAAPHPRVPSLGDKAFTVLVIPTGKALETYRILE